jgi:uncharacterized protein (DUF1800 family)
MSESEDAAIMAAMSISPVDAAHLLRRSGFGVTQAALSELTQCASREAAVDRVLDTSKAPSASLPIPTTRPSDNFTAWRTMSQWWLERMRTSPTPIVEKMTLFWHGHFCSGLDKVGDMGILAQQHMTLRQHALGDFHELAQAVSIDPAMMGYLDNWFNLAGRVQENFARELMELFTMGLGYYTQDDVVSMARAWTGYSVGDEGRTFLLRSQYHDNGTKQLFGVAPRNWDGPSALTEILKGSKATPASRFVAAKLFSFLAYPVAPSDPVVTPLAEAFRSSNLSIAALLRAIFTSDAFWSPAARHALVRSPIEWFVAGMQATGTNATMISTEHLGLAGQVLFLPPEVAGWGRNEEWLGTAAVWGRSQWATLARYFAWRDGWLKGVEWLPVPEMVQKALDAFGIVDPAPTTRAALEAACTTTIARGYGGTLRLVLVQLLLLSPDFMVA